MEVLLCKRVNDLPHSLFHLLNCLITTASELWEYPKVTGTKVWTYWGVEELSWCPSWSNSLWQGWNCGLIYCPGGNATDLIWRVLASSDGISSWTPLKPQNSNPNPNSLEISSAVLTSLLLPHLSSSLTDSLPTFNLLCHSLTNARFMQDAPKPVWSIPYISVAFFPKFKTEFYSISFF